MSHILFTGCSFSAGYGLLNGKDDDDLWVNILSNRFKHFNKTNASVPGNSNDKIFSDTVFNITKFDIEYAFVQWTSMPRIIIELGLELYKTKQSFCGGDVKYNYSLVDAELSSEYINKVKNMLFTMMHDHGEISKLVYYVNSLIQLGNRLNTKIFFINGLCPWDHNFFEILYDVDAPSQYTSYTQMLLKSKLRDDIETYQIYKKMHNEYQLYGGIQSQYWINLYNSMKMMQVDDASSDDKHPGIKSNKRFSEFCYEVVKEKIDIK